MPIKFDRDKIERGLIIHVRSNSKIGRLIRWALDKWLARICKRQNVPPQRVWGNHDGMLVAVPSTNFLGIGEALARGSTLTSLEQYEHDINSGTLEVRAFRVKDVGEREKMWASANWLNHVKGTGYSYSAYPRLLIKSLLFDWSESDLRLIKWIGKKAAGWEWRNWCTEGAARAWSKWTPPGLDVFQTKNPTPLTVEQVAGLVPMKPSKTITLEEVTDMVLVEKGPIDSRTT